jgi:hypothetical protein
MSAPSFSISFDYRCPFAKVMHLHVLRALDAGAAYEVAFEPWSLNQPHRADGDPDVWSDERRDPDLLALAAGVSVRDQQPQLFAAAHEALFRGRHDKGLSMKVPDEVFDVLASVDVDVDSVRADVASRRPHAVIGESHERLLRFEPFGVPTFFVGDDAVFVRYMDDPSDDWEASRELVDSILHSIEQRPSLNEFKHTQLRR